MFKRVNGHDNIRRFFYRRGEVAGFLNTGGNRVLPCRFKEAITNINAQYSSGSFLGHFYCLSPVTAAEINDDLTFNCVEKNLA